MLNFRGVQQNQAGFEIKDSNPSGWIIQKDFFPDFCPEGYAGCSSQVAVKNLSGVIFT